MYESSIDFSKYSSIKIGAPTPITILEKRDVPRLAELESSVCVGHACNLIVSPEARGLVMLGKDFDYIEECADFIEVGAATPSGKIFAFFKARDFGGLEFLHALPGSAGGLLKMNAGMKQHEMSGVVIGACVNGCWVDSAELGLSYRTSRICGIISAVRFAKRAGFSQEVLRACKDMRKTHPKMPSCGSCFKNPSGDFAGRLLEAAGLKGFVRNGVGFSSEHANFLVNHGGAKFEDVIYAIDHAQKVVLEKSGILLEKEVKIIE